MPLSFSFSRYCPSRSHPYASHRPHECKRAIHGKGTSQRFLSSGPTMNAVRWEVVVQLPIKNFLI
jgi:hypothetical protein